MFNIAKIACRKAQLAAIICKAVYRQTRVSLAAASAQAPIMKAVGEFERRFQERRVLEEKAAHLIASVSPFDVADIRPDVMLYGPLVAYGLMSVQASTGGLLNLPYKERDRGIYVQIAREILGDSETLEQLLELESLLKEKGASYGE